MGTCLVYFKKYWMRFAALERCGFWVFGLLGAEHHRDGVWT